MDNQSETPHDSNDDPPRPERMPPLSPLLKFLAGFAIVGLLILFLLPVYRSSPQAARRNHCINNLKQIAMGLDRYAEAHGAYPPAYTTDADGKPLHSWRTLILPFLEHEQLFKKIDLTKPWDDAVNEKARNSVVEVYQCPSLVDLGDGDQRTPYLAVVTPDSVIRTAHSRRPEDIEAVKERTLLVIDADDAHAVPWMSPEDADEALILSLDENANLSHAGGTLAVLANGHVQMLSEGMDAPSRRALISVSADDNAILEYDE